MINCPKCCDPLTDDQFKILIKEFATTVEGRSTIRQILKQNDKRVKTRMPSMKDSESNILANIIKYLTELRNKQHLTQSSLARELGVSEWTVHRWETLGKGPGVEMCEKWANFLGSDLRTVLVNIDK